MAGQVNGTGQEPNKVVIIGGSLAGLMHGVMLKRRGHDVSILERNATNIQHGEAAGIRAGQEVQEFFKKFDSISQPYFLDCPGLQFIDRDAKKQKFISFPMAMTAWTTLYYRLRANFDGFPSEHCSHPPKATETEGVATFNLGKRVKDVSYGGEKVIVKFEDINNNTDGSLNADLVIAADGCNSTVRQRLLPALDRPYAGYVAWRGSVPEKDASEETRQLLGNDFVVYKMPRNYILVYMIPGPNGNLEPGKRILNFVWYYNCPGDSEEYAEIMVDCDGHAHHSTIPPGKMHPRVWAKQQIYAREQLARPFAELVEKTTEPFISSVADTITTQASFFDGKLLLVGDALALFRPHVALSANQAAMNCLALEKVLDGKISKSEWERQVLAYGATVRQLSIAAGDFTQFGGLKAISSWLKYGLVLGQQRLGSCLPFLT